MQVKLPIGIRLAPSPAAARGSLALEPAATSACDRAGPGRRWAVFTPQAAGLKRFQDAFQAISTPPSPFLLERPRFDLETPGGAILGDETSGDRSDPARRDEKVVRAISHPGARRWPADHAVDHNQRDMNAGRPKMAGQGFGERALRHLGLRKHRRACRAAPRGGRADDDDRALGPAAHGGNDLAGGEEKAERVDAPGALEVLRLDLLNVAPDA